MRLALLLATFAWLGAAIPAAAQTGAARAEAQVRRIVESASFRKAAAALREGHERWVGDTVALTEIPAPPFKEEARAKAYLDMFRRRGLADVEMDEEGNVLGLRKGAGGGGLVIVSAHLDTVFPEGTDVKVRREGDKLHAPGVGDDSAGLATQLALIDTMRAGNVRTKSDILFVGTVGEEGLGDLRGVRHLFTRGKYKDRAKAFLSLDGTGLEGFVTGGAGSKRYRVTYKGPGGHSYGAFGLVNPAAALAGALADFHRLQVPKTPKTTYNVGVIGGGTSVNAIPRDAWAEIDMRSESAEELAKLERSFLALLPQAAEAENRARSVREGPVTFEAKPIGDRPAGRTPLGSDLVQFASAAFRVNGIEPSYDSASTDANLPISLGIPAITLPRVATGGRAHAPDEWIGIGKADNVKLKRILLAAILATAGTP